MSDQFLSMGIVVWHSGLSTKQSAELERIQRRACRTILGHHFTSYIEPVNVYNMQSLEDRRKHHCRFYRTSHLLPPSRFECHGIKDQGNSANLSQFPAKTKHFKNSPVPYYLSLLNK